MEESQHSPDMFFNISLLLLMFIVTIIIKMTITNVEIWLLFSVYVPSFAPLSFPGRGICGSLTGFFFFHKRFDQSFSRPGWRVLSQGDRGCTLYCYWHGSVKYVPTPLAMKWVGSNENSQKSLLKHLGGFIIIYLLSLLILLDCLYFH